VGCRRTAEQHELVRLVVRDGDLAVGRTLPGRGAWLCDSSASCLELAVKRKAIGRALRTDIDPAAINSLRTKLADRARMGD
jgi:predicted RNA-binding protein YlxR (DUF448 family)